MNQIDIWIEKVLELVPTYELLHYGKTKHHAIANFYRIQLGLPVLSNHEEAMVFIEELFRIPFEELVEVPKMLNRVS